MKTKVGGTRYVGKEKQGLGIGGQGPSQRRRVPASVAQFVTRVKTVQELRERTFFFTERCRNLYENKGVPWKTLEGSGNVYENKGVPWKTLEGSGNVYENKGDSR